MPSLSGTQLIGTDLTFANLEGAILRDADLHNAFLGGAKLSVRVTLPNGEIGEWVNATLSGSNLSGADLNSADLTGISLAGANLSGTNLTNATLSDVRGLFQDQLDKACGKPKMLPPGLILDKPCPPRSVASPFDQKATP